MWWYVSGKSLLVSLVVSLLGACYVRAEYVDPAVLDACPGYTATNVKVQRDGLTADLVLGGKPCNVFGNDIQKLSLSVVYETGTETCLLGY
jgi:alpha-glucosidase